jgi:hypothetical protein
MTYRIFRSSSVLCALALIVACGRTQQSNILPVMQARPFASSGSLLYVLDNLSGRRLSVYSFPSGTPEKPISMPNKGFAYICSDQSGNVYAPSYGVIFKYAHGGHRPIAYLQDTGEFGGQCAADPKTGNLATNDGGGIKGCYVGLYLHGKGKPTCLTAVHIAIAYPAYDSNGDLFFVYAGKTQPRLLGELPAGGSKILKIALSNTVTTIWCVQWDGQDVAIQGKLPGTIDQPVVIQRIHVVGSKGTVVKTVHFSGWNDSDQHFWISGDLIVAPLNYNGLGFWNYPQGGKNIGSVTAAHFEDWTVSVTP